MNVGVCAIIRDCYENYLKEFIEWHSLIGVDYFFIYDNGSQIPIKTILDGDNIFICDFPGDVKQLPAYMDCINKQKSGEQIKCDWIAFIDDDEFILPECGNIKTVLSDYNNYSALGINWLVFGSSGLKEKTDEKQIFKFTKILDYKEPINRHIKTICKPETIVGFQTPHNCIFNYGYCVDTNKNILNGPFTITPIHKKIWINHYYLKSENEFLKKINRGRADTGDTNSQLKMKIFYDIEKIPVLENDYIINLYNKIKQYERK